MRHREQAALDLQFTLQGVDTQAGQDRSGCGAIPQQQLVSEQPLQLVVEAVDHVRAHPVRPFAAIGAGTLEVKLDRQLQVHMALTLPAVIDAIEFTQCAPVFMHREIMGDKLHGGVAVEKELP